MGRYKWGHKSPNNLIRVVMICGVVSPLRGVGTIVILHITPRELTMNLQVLAVSSGQRAARSASQLAMDNVRECRHDEYSRLN